MLMGYLYQTPAKAVAFYDDKIKGLDANLQELEKIVSGKSQQLRIVEEGELSFHSISAFYSFFALVPFIDFLQFSDRRCLLARPPHSRLLRELNEMMRYNRGLFLGWHGILFSKRVNKRNLETLVINRSLFKRGHK